MNRLRLLLTGLALSGLSAAASAQDIDLNVSGGWVLNSNSPDEIGDVISTGTGPYPCTLPSPDDSNTAKVQWDIKHMTGPTIGEAFRVSDSARYSGEAHAECVLPAVSASASKGGFCEFVHSSAGSISYDFTSNAAVTTSGRDPHSSGQASAACTITLYGVLVLPPLIKPPFQVQLSNSASSTGTAAPQISNFPHTTGTKNNRNYFSVTASVNLSSSIHIPPPPPGSPPDDAFEVLWAMPASNSSITLF